MHRTAVPGALLLAWTLTVLVLAPAPPAAAHTALRASTPADGEELTAPPEEIRLQFTDDVLDLGSQVAVTGPSGQVTLGAAAVQGATVTAALPPQLPGGAYTVQWRVTAEDGHPISGSFGFTIVTAPEEPSPGATATAPAGPAPTGTGEPTASAPAPDVETTAPAVGEGGDAEASSAWLFAIPALLVAAGVAAVVIGRRRGRQG